MSEEDVEIVRGVFEAFNQRDIPLLLSYAASDAVGDWSGSVGPYRDVYRGHAELKAFWEDFLDAWEEVRMEPDELQDLGDGRVLSVIRTVGLGRGSGVEVTATGGTIIWTIRNGKIVHSKLFQGKDEALEAAGLSE